MLEKGKKLLSYPKRCSVIGSSEDSRNLLESFDTFLFDCDGTLWDGDDPIEGAIDTLKFLLSENKQVRYVTNNSSKSRVEFAQKFVKLGFPPVNPDHIISSGSSAVYYAKKELKKKDEPSKNVVFFIGYSSIHEELQKAGIESISASEIDLPSKINDWKDFQKDPRVGAVLVAADWDLTYAKATAAASYLSDEDVLFIGTNSDPRLPCVNPGVFNCDTGSIVAMLEYTTGRKATFAGKPESIMWDHAAHEFEQSGIKIEKALMVGDSLNTDIKFANSAEPPIASLLVQTGNHKLKHVKKIIESSCPEWDKVPTFVAASLKDAFSQ